MSIMPLPSMQVPADTQLLYDIIQNLHQLSDSMGKLGGLSTFKDKTIPTSSLQIVAQTLNVVSNKQILGTEEQAFTFTYPDFGSIPVISALPIVGTSNSLQRSVTVTLTSKTSSITTGIVKFSSPGIFTVDIDLTAIGPSPTYQA